MATCPTCGTPVEVVQADEGTAHYRALASSTGPDPENSSGVGRRLRDAVVCPECGKGELPRGDLRGRCSNCNCFFSAPTEGLSQEEWEALPDRDKWRVSRTGRRIPVVAVSVHEPSQETKGEGR